MIILISSIVGAIVLVGIAVFFKKRNGKEIGDIKTKKEKMVKNS